ncbi:DUF4235 domain-containing protein [Streptomyces sp. NPDC058576]|uniref:DUF4235 domain-containing protein n=1 Tax=Streptomyces sp. NPDC058576 TaxID=3346547 RepID=UPI00364866B3
MKASKLAYKPVGFALGAVSGMIASAVFKQTWKIVEGEGDAPDALDEDRPWRQILLAAAVQGAIFAVVKATVERSGAQATRRVTGTWPA